MCQSEPAPEPAPEETVDPCEGARPPGDGEVVEGDSAEGVPEGEPHPDAPREDVPEEEPAEEGEAKPEPAPEDEPRPEPDAPTTNAAASEDDVVCAYAGLPVSAPDTAAGGQEAAPVLESATGARNAATAAGKLPRPAGVTTGLLVTSRELRP